MNSYEYGNTRLRAMKSRIIPHRQMVELASCDSIDHFISQLTRTAYQHSVEIILAQQTGMVSIPHILNQNMSETIGKIPRFYKGQAEQWIRLLFWQYDIKNIKTVLRGLTQQFPAPEIQQALLPVGTIPTGLMSELTKASNARIAVDTLATLRFPVAQPLLQMQAKRPGAELPTIEMALDQWYFEQVNKMLKPGIPGAREMRAALQMDADLINITTALRLVHSYPQHKPLPENPESLFTQPGQVPISLLKEAIAQENVRDAISILSRSVYADLLHYGLQAYQQSNSLGRIEKLFNQHNRQRRAQQMLKDPLGIGVPLGYLALKENELQNLRHIALFTNLGFSPKEIELELEQIL